MSKNRPHKPVLFRRTWLQRGVTLAWMVLGCLSLPAQTAPGTQSLVPEEAIQQGQQKGVETWEGTLFGQDSYKPDSYARIEVVPNPGFEFEKWEGDQIADPTAPKTFVTMSDHVKIKPHYRRIWNVIAAPDNKEAGKVTGSGDYPEGSEVKLTVEPNEGFKFLGWEGKGIQEEEKEALETTITVEGDHDIVARFENDNQDENSGGGGGGGGDSDQNQDQNEDQNENQDQQDQQDEQNQDQQDQQDEQEQEQQDQPQENHDPGDQTEQPEDQGGEEEQPQEPDTGEEDQQEDQGEEEQPQSPEGEEETPAQETPADGPPVPLQMTPEEAIRLLEAMEGDEKKLPLFIVTPPDKKDSKKDW